MILGRLPASTSLIIPVGGTERAAVDDARLHEDGKLC